MEGNMVSIDKFIESVRNIDPEVKTICTQGACYKFAKFVNLYYPLSEFYISLDKQHIIIRYKDNYYDINGKCLGDGYIPMTEEDRDECETWSFSKKYFVGKECAYCGEIIT